MKGWLEKYNDGGPVQPNYNDYSVSAGPGFQGDGYSNVGRNYSPAWGGQFQDGGKVKPITVTDKKDPRLKAYQDSLYVRNKYSQSFGPGSKTRPLTKKEKEFWKDEKTGLLPNLVEYSPKSGKDEGYFGHFKKPTQPVIYQKPEPTPQSTIDFMEGNYAQEPITEIPQPQASAYGQVVDPRTGYTHMTRQGSVMYPMVGQNVPEMAMGGSLPGATGSMYARVGAPSEDKGRNKVYKTDASAQNGTELENAYAKWPALRNMGTAAVNKDYGLGLGLGYGGVEFMHPNLGEVNYDNGVLLNQSPGKNSTTYNPLTDDAQSVRLDMLHGMHQDPTFSKHRDAFKQSVLSDPSIKGDMNHWYNEDKKKDRAGDGKDQWMNNYIDGQMRTLLFEGDRKSRNYSDKEANQLLSNPKIKKSFNKLNDYLKTGYSYGQGPRAKNGKKVIKDDRGQWAHPGEITEIGSNQITMQGVPYPVMGVSDTGDTQMMYPNQEYQYNGNSVTEYPMMQDGGVLDSIVNVGKGAVKYVDNLIKTGINKLSAMDEPDPNIAIAAAEVESRRMKEKFMKERLAMESGFSKFSRLREDHPKTKKLESQIGRTEWNSDGYNKSYQIDKNKVKLNTGRFTGANVSSKLIDDLAEAAKRNNIPIGQMLTLAARESTFGEQKGKNVDWEKKDIYTSGWDVANDYTPYEALRFLADKKVPGVNVNKSRRAWTYDIDDENKINSYLNSHPKLFDDYKKKLNSTPDIGNKNYFDLSAEFLKKKGIKGYNPGDPNYEKMFNQDYDILKQDKALMSYLKKKGYKYEQGGQLTKLDQLTNFTNYNTKQPGGWLDKYQ